MACFNATRFIVLLLSLIVFLAVSNTRLQDFFGQQFVALKKTQGLICSSQAQWGGRTWHSLLRLADWTRVTLSWGLASRCKMGLCKLRALNPGLLVRDNGKGTWVAPWEVMRKRALSPSCKIVCSPCTAGRHYVTSFISAGSPGFHHVA